MAKKKEETVETPVVETPVVEIEVQAEEVVLNQVPAERQDPGHATRAYRG